MVPEEDSIGKIKSLNKLLEYQMAWKKAPNKAPDR